MEDLQAEVIPSLRTASKDMLPEVPAVGNVPARKLKKGMDPPKAPNLHAKRKIDYVMERDADIPYVRKWLKEPFVEKYRLHPSFWSFWNHNELKVCVSLFLCFSAASVRCSVALNLSFS